MGSLLVYKLLASIILPEFVKNEHTTNIASSYSLALYIITQLGQQAQPFSCKFPHHPQGL